MKHCTLFAPHPLSYFVQFSFFYHHIAESNSTHGSKDATRIL